MPAVGRELDAIRDRIKEALGDLIAPPPEGTGDVVYHYTDAFAVAAILENHGLRATSLAYLNDRQECLFGMERFAEATSQRDPAASAAFQDQLLEHLRSEDKVLDGASELYGCSFSFDGDLLSQWRGYGEDGIGYALGFDRATLDRLLIPQGMQYPVRYGDEEHARIVEAVLDALADSEVDQEEFVQLLAEFAPMMKHGGFHEEKEYRLIISNLQGEYEETICVRPQHGTFIPYIPLGVPEGERLPIREIVIGPCVDFRKAEQGIRRLLSITGYTKVEISASSVPYLRRSL